MAVARKTKPRVKRKQPARRKKASKPRARPAPVRRTIEKTFITYHHDPYAFHYAPWRVLNYNVPPAVTAPRQVVKDQATQTVSMHSMGVGPSIVRASV